MKNIIIAIAIIVAALMIGFFAFNSYIYNEKQADSSVVGEYGDVGALPADGGERPVEAPAQNMTLGMKTWVWERALYNDGREIVPAQEGAFTLTFTDDTSFSVTTDCNSMGGMYVASENSLTFSDIFSTRMYCEGSQETEFSKLLEDTNMYHFTSDGKLILDLKFDSGTVTLR